MKRWIVLLFFVFVAYIPATIGSGFVPGEWYAQLKKPFWNPPQWVFAPVWTALYLLIGVAGYVYWATKSDSGKAGGFSIYAVQLMLNSAWTWLFFGLKSPAFAMVDIIALFVVIIINIILFKKVSKWAGWLLVPYVLWVGFALLLNVALYALNR